MPRLTRFLLLAVLVAAAVMPTGCKKAGLRGVCTTWLGMGGCSEIVSYTINGENRMRFVDSLFFSRKVFNRAEPWRYTEENCGKISGIDMMCKLNHYSSYPYLIQPLSSYFTDEGELYFISGVFRKNNLAYPTYINDSLPPGYYWKFKYSDGSYSISKTDSLNNIYIIKVEKLNSDSNTLENAQNCVN